MNNFRDTWASVATMNSTLQQSCTLARNRDDGDGDNDTYAVQVFGIAFEAPPNGQTQISSCATKNNATYYFASDGADIATAFSEIAATINDLRLTQ
jgi:hypothetical protein